MKLHQFPSKVRRSATPWMALGLAATLTWPVFLFAQVPPIINYQGRVVVAGVNFDGQGQFKFTLVNSTGTQTFWSNDGTSTGGGPPAVAVTLPVSKGLYAVLLGDVSVPNMTAIPTTVFNNADVRLRIWYNDGVNGFQLLSPDQRIATVGYAMMAGQAATVPDGSITSGKIAPGAVGATQLAPGAAAANLAASGQSGVPSGGIILSDDPNAAELIAAGYVKIGAVSLPSKEWSLGASGEPPSQRSSHTAVWTGSEMIVWGGFDGTSYEGGGSRFNPVANAWSPMLSNTGRPTVRSRHSAVWTGSEMIVWGGTNTSGYLNTGGRYNPVTDTWMETPVGTAPEGRAMHTAVWTGREMIIWGGSHLGGTHDSAFTYLQEQRGSLQSEDRHLAACDHRRCAAAPGRPSQRCVDWLRNAGLRRGHGHPLRLHAPPNPVHLPKTMTSAKTRVSDPIGRLSRVLILGLCLPGWSQSTNEALANLLADRTAIERVYHAHRLGTKPPFEQVLPPDVIEKLVRQDQHKEAVPKKVYGITITPAQLEAEVQRINATTRAPETLAELKQALGNDPQRFARTVAHPILVERALRDRFDNDDALHAAQRRQCEAVRSTLLSVRTNSASSDQLVSKLKELKTGSVTETTWRLGARPASKASDAAPQTPPPPVTGKASGGLYSVETTIQVAQVLNPPAGSREDQEAYFEDLPEQLQRLLEAQLRNPGDVSAVVELPHGFALYIAKTRTPDSLSAAALSINKRSYEEWLASQP